MVLLNNGCSGADLWEEALLKEYNMADVFDDYTMSLIQFGYVALFSAAFPLAPLLAMINNLVQTRVDAYKICKTRCDFCIFFITRTTVQ